MRPSLFEGALAASFLLHAAAWHSAARLLPGGRQPDEKTVELDMTQPFRLTSNLLLKGLGGPPGPPRRQEARPEAPRKELQDSPDAAPAVPPPAPAKEPEEGLAESQARAQTNPPVGLSGGLPGGAGKGGEGGSPWLHLTRLPRLADKADLERALKRFYPEEERRMGREAEVTLHLHIDEKGRVSAFEVVRSGGPAFDEAAGKVALALEFVPAMVGQLPAAVKVKQTISFRLKG